MTTGANSSDAGNVLNKPAGEPFVNGRYLEHFSYIAVDSVQSSFETLVKDEIVSIPGKTQSINCHTASKKYDESTIYYHDQT
ncbi:MAG: hypothetical protein ABI675_25355 [Chitinophagaceae bacterium]